MSCDAFLERIDALLDGSLARFERDEANRHLQECAACRELHAALAAGRENVNDAQGVEDAQLSMRILSRTSGAACGSAVSRLCAWSDGELDTVDTDLVAGHLRHCLECAGLARALARLQVELPRLAAVDPGPAFLESVLARTSRRARRASLGERIAARLVQLLDRPRFALEAAFVATAILVVPMLAPGSPLAGVPESALDILRKPPVQSRVVIGQVRTRIGDLGSTLASGANSAWQTTQAIVVEDATATAASVTRNCASTWDTIRRRFGTPRDSDASREEGAGKTRVIETPNPPRRT